jgi:hypothetical protein
MLLIAADSSMGYEEALASVPRARRSSRPQLVMSEDSVGTETPVPMTCASFFGCLRHRWSAKY